MPVSYEYSTHPVAVGPQTAAGPALPAPHACLNCGAALADRFCPQCGQPADTHRITLKYLLLHDLPHSIWHVDKGLLHTFWQMLTRPGLTIREYLAGQRTRQFRPVSYLLLLVGLSTLLMSAFQPDIHKAALLGQPMTALTGIVMERYFATFLKHPSLGQLFFLPLNSLAAWLLLRRAGYNYAEVLTANAFISGTLAIINMLIMLPALLSGNPAHLKLASLLIFIPTLLYSLWVNAQMLEAAPLTAVRRYGRALGISLLQIVLLLVFLTLFIIGLTVQVLREHPQLRKDSVPKKPSTAATRGKGFPLHQREAFGVGFIRRS